MMRNSKKPKGSQLSRRNLLKAAAAGMLAAAAATLLRSRPLASAAEPGEMLKTLVVYYSRTGNTRELAGQIQVITGGDIVELETVQPYPAEYRATTEQVKKELASNFYPPLKVTVEDVSQYDLVFVGSPCWWGTFASPVRGFLAQHDFSGRRLAPFMTHGGSGLGKSLEDLKTLCPGATILEGLAVRGGSVDRAGPEIRQWLNRLGINR